MKVSIYTKQANSAKALEKALHNNNVLCQIQRQEIQHNEYRSKSDALLLMPDTCLSEKCLSDTSEPIIILGKKEEFKVRNEAILKRCIFMNASIPPEDLAVFLKEFLCVHHEFESKESNKVGHITLNRERRTILFHGNQIKLTRKEYFLLELLTANCGQVVSKERIARIVWDRCMYVSSNTIEVYICRLRKKLKEIDVKSCIRTVSCLGYEFVI